MSEFSFSELLRNPQKTSHHQPGLKTRCARCTCPLEWDGYTYWHRDAVMTVYGHNPEPRYPRSQNGEVRK